MRRFFCVLFCLMLCIAGCSKKDESINPDEEVIKNPEKFVSFDVNEAIKDNTSLIVFFSQMDTVESISDQLMELTESSQFKIMPGIQYEEEDLNFESTSSRAYLEYKNDILPDISNEIYNLEQYDTIYLGFPLWYNKAPQIIRTFLNSYDLSDKNVICFMVGEESEENLEEYQENGTWIKTSVFRSDMNRQELIIWLNSIEF